MVMMEGDLVLRQKLKVPIWQYFLFKPNANREPHNINKTTCQLCTMKMAAIGNTSDLHTNTSKCTTKVKLPKWGPQQNHNPGGQTHNHP